MKKTYMNPNMVIVKIKSQHLLAGSITDDTTKVKFDSDASAITDPNEMDARGFDFGFNDEY